MIKLNQIAKLKEDIKKLQDDSLKATGALQQTLKRLKKEFGCDNIKDARKKLRQLKVELERENKETERALKVYAENWGNVISDEEEDDDDADD